MPVEPPPCEWQFRNATDADENGVVGVGGDLEPGTLLHAYRSGMFPMPFGRKRLIWFSPDPRAVIPLYGLHVSRSLRRSTTRFDTSRDASFTEVMMRCGDPTRSHGWINRAFVDASTELHRLGWAHSVECWDESGALVGGLYGVWIGRFFAGESMFHAARDASKVALIALVEWLNDTGAKLLDVQWPTPHLDSLGAVTIPRAEYLRQLRVALAQPADETTAPGEAAGNVSSS
ncbi:leucyl/phenylalanyl-tRNA--protein transferase [soil metagenome]